MKLPLLLSAFLVSAASCQCGPANLCQGVKCGQGLECAPATGACVSTGPQDAGPPDAGACGTACTAEAPVCDPVGKQCVVCASSSDCPSATPYCDPTVAPRGACYECRTLLDCAGLAMDCDFVTHRCFSYLDAGALDAGPTVDAVVYGHTATTLYKVNATTKAVTAVADFHDCDGDVIDLALDQFSRAWVTTRTGLFTLDLRTALCTEVASGGFSSFPNSLSFVPKGTLDPAVEALVGYDGSSYVRINPMTGVIQNIGTLGGGFVSSGDIVSVIDGGTYLTVKDPNGSASTNYLVEVNPATGGLVRNLGMLPFNDVFGLGFWGGSLYGFSNGGTLFEITITGSTTSSAAVPNAMNHQWNGAGSTTAAAIR